MIRYLRLATVHLALAAMMLRALLPAGWMPGEAAGSPLVVCTMAGPLLIHLGADGKPAKQKPADEDARHHTICPFGAAPQLAPPMTVAEIAPSSFAVLAADDSRVAFVVRAAHYSPQSPRAPPMA